MKRHFPGLHLESKNGSDLLEGVFLVRVVQASYRWHREKPFFALQFSILEPKERVSQIFSGRLYCTPKALWKLNWFLRDFGYDNDLFTRDEIDEKALIGLRGVIQTSCTTLRGGSFLNCKSTIHRSMRYCSRIIWVRAPRLDEASSMRQITS